MACANFKRRECGFCTGAECADHAPIDAKLEEESLLWEEHDDRIYFDRCYESDSVGAALDEELALADVVMSRVVRAWLDGGE